MYFSISPWEYPEYSGNSLRLVFLFFSEDTAGFTANTEYINYSLDLERKTRIIRKIIKRSSEMAKFAIPAQEISKN